MYRRELLLLLPRRRTLTNFVFQLSETNMRIREAVKIWFPLDQARKYNYIMPARSLDDEMYRNELMREHKVPTPLQSTFAQRKCSQARVHQE